MLERFGLVSFPVAFPLALANDPFLHSCYFPGGGICTSGGFCSGPKCSMSDFPGSSCGLCLAGCGASSKDYVCQSFGLAAYTTGTVQTNCTGVSAAGGGGRCPGTSVCCYISGYLLNLRRGGVGS